MELLDHGLRNICEGCVAEGLFSTDVIKSYFIMLELPQGTTEIFEARYFLLGYGRFLSLPLLVQ